MSDLLDEDEDDHSTALAKVVDVDDPLGWHRVRFTIPGKMQLSDWAWPRAKGGLHVAPRVDDAILVHFVGGNKDVAVYSPAWWVAKNAPADIAAAGTQGHLVHAFELGGIGDISFRVTIDERQGSRSVRIYAFDTLNNIEVCAIELDLEKRGLVLYGLTGISIQSDGYVQVTAPIVQMNERTVQIKGGPI